MKFQPGDRVVLTEHLWTRHELLPDSWECPAKKGTRGTVRGQALIVGDYYLVRFADGSEHAMRGVHLELASALEQLAAVGE